ncbi:FHA domain-containing protein [Terrabacter sp. Ter38]|uniref:FHA domain-containing protein n=1 Tax=Terrabacter sp. Ter38 TaxID=2926030 RepID=UPI00211845F6|nr:FHA domain-containing protein [Terrabacter sp. Ter38]
MHLLIGLDEDDERTIAASDAADGGDIDDVVEVLTAGGMRKAHHFVGVHWQPRTRIVAFGPVSALVSLADGTEHDVRATSSRVWTDLELPDHPDRVVLRVLEESERAQPVPAQDLMAGPPSGGPAPAASPAAPGESAQLTVPDEPAEATPDTGTTRQPAPSIAVADTPVVSSRRDAAAEPRPDQSAPAGGIPTFAASAGGDSTSAAVHGAQVGPDRSAWERSWTQGSTPRNPSEPSAASHEFTTTAADSGVVRPEEPVAQADSENEADSFPPATDITPEPPVAPAPALRSWTSVAPAVPVRATPTSDVVGDDAGPSPIASTPLAPVAATDPAASAPVSDDLPVAAAARDLDSTWAARPVLDPDPGSPTSTTPSAPVGGAVRPPVPGPATAGLDDAGDVADEQPAAPPSYDYLFGHTTAADEHRKVLASLTRSDDEETGHDEDDDLPAPVGPSVPPVAGASDAPVSNAAPTPEVPARPLPSAPVVPEGGLISSVPWASPAPAVDVPKPEPEPQVPTFSGRHTPPPAPSLLPPMNTPPPGVRAPEATPLISTGPPPASTGPAPAPAAASTPPAVTAYAEAAQPPAEPTFDVPISLPAAVPPAAPVAPRAPVPEPVAPTSAPALDVGPGTDDDDETELTVDRSALLEARNAAQNQTFSGPSVLAVLCSAGHPTPPHSDRCRICGSSIPPQEPFTMPRPPLGVLRLSTGDVVTLDRSVLLGRAPKLGDGLAVHDRPHVVKVPSPERDVSRNHVEVILEGWHVLIRDLGTTNGTTVTLPGESPLRLRANDQQVLEPGSLVSMADEVSFTFEAAS